MFIAIREINSFIDLSTHLPSLYMYAIHHHTPPLHTTVASSSFPLHARPLATSPKGKGQGVAAAGSQSQESPGSWPWRGPSTAKEKNPGGKGRTDSSSPFEGGARTIRPETPSVDQILPFSFSTFFRPAADPTPLFPHPSSFKVSTIRRKGQPSSHPTKDTESEKFISPPPPFSEESRSLRPRKRREVDDALKM